MHELRVLCILILFLGLAICQTPLPTYELMLVDNFSVPSLSMKCTGPCYPLVEAASGPGILGGARLVQLQSNQGSITCETAPNGGGLEFDVYGTKVNNDLYSYQQSAYLIYDANEFPVNPYGLGRVDLYNGQAGNGYFEFSLTNSAERNFWTMNITVFSGIKNCTASFFPCTGTDICINYVPFGEFPDCDLHNVGAITTTILAISDSSSQA